MRIDVSIVIVSWNCKQMLADCIRSLQSQLDAQTSEIIVVDNASSDGTVTAIRDQFPEVKLIESGGNLGFARGNNIGIEIAQGEYLCLINPDVVVGDGCVSRMLQFMKENSDVGMLGPQIVGPDGAVQRSCMRTPTLWNQLCRTLALDRLIRRSRLFGGYLMNDFQHNTLRDVEVINGCFWMVRKAALNDVGLLDPRYWMYADDLDWCLRFRRAGWRIVFLPAAKAIHYGGGSSRQTPVSCYIEMQRANLQYWRKYHGWVSCQCYWGLLCLAHTTRMVSSMLIFALNPAGQRERATMAVKKHAACIRWLNRQLVR